MIRRLAVLLMCLTLLCVPCSGEDAADSQTARSPFDVPDAAVRSLQRRRRCGLPDLCHIPVPAGRGLYQALIEQRWAEIEPDIRLVRAGWNCYHDGIPEGIDVIMYDAIYRNDLIRAGAIRPIDIADVWEAEDIFPFALEGLTVDGSLYGIPVFLCGNFLIYDRDCVILAGAAHITDLDGESGLLLIASDDPSDREQYRLEVIADAAGGSNEGVEQIMALIDRLAIEAHKKDGSQSF